MIEKVRAGDRVAAERPADEGLIEPTAPAETIGVLANAAEAHTRTWISYVDHNGTASERIVEPVRVADGWLTAYDDGADQPTHLRPAPDLHCQAGQLTAEAQWKVGHR